MTGGFDPTWGPPSTGATQPPADISFPTTEPAEGATPLPHLTSFPPPPPDNFAALYQKWYNRLKAIYNTRSDTEIQEKAVQAATEEEARERTEARAEARERQAQ